MEAVFSETNFKKMRINLRPATQADLGDTKLLFVAAILRSCKNDYKPEQLQAWAATIDNHQRWVDAVSKQYFLVAEEDHKIAGFGSLKDNDYIDFIYVHPDYHRKKVAKHIYLALEKEAILKNSLTLTANVSITARPFFLAQGFETERENKNQVRGFEIINYRMKKSLKPN